MCLALRSTPFVKTELNTFLSALLNSGYFPNPEAILAFFMSKFSPFFYQLKLRQCDYTWAICSSTDLAIFEPRISLALSFPFLAAMTRHSWGLNLSSSVSSWSSKYSPLSSLLIFISPKLTSALLFPFFAAYLKHPIARLLSLWTTTPSLYIVLEGQRLSRLLKSYPIALSPSWSPKSAALW